MEFEEWWKISHYNFEVEEKELVYDAWKASRIATQIEDYEWFLGLTRMNDGTDMEQVVEKELERLKHGS